MTIERSLDPWTHVIATSAYIDDSELHADERGVILSISPPGASAGSAQRDDIVTFSLVPAGGGSDQELLELRGIPASGTHDLRLLADLTMRYSIDPRMAGIALDDASRRLHALERLRIAGQSPSQFATSLRLALGRVLHTRLAISAHAQALAIEKELGTTETAADRIAAIMHSLEADSASYVDQLSALTTEEGPERDADPASPS